MANRNPAPIKIENIDVSKITLSKPTEITYGNLVYVNYRGGPLRVILPLMSVPMGVSKFADEKGDTKNDKYSLSFSFEGMETNPSLKLAHDKIHEIDEQLLTLIDEQKNVFYTADPGRAKLNKELIRQSRWNEPLKRYIDKNGKEYPETFRASIALDRANSSRFESITGKPLLIDPSNMMVDVSPESVEDVIMRNCKIQGVVEISYIFIAKKKPHTTSIKWKFGHGVIHSVDTGEAWDLIIDETPTETPVIVSEEPEEPEDAEMEPEDEVPEDDEEVNEEPVVAIPKKKAPVKKVTPRVATA